MITHEVFPTHVGVFLSPGQAQARPGSVFPTHVGVFPSGRSTSIPTTRLPHARGGVSVRGGHPLHDLESSPRTWGCFRSCMISGRVGKVFPTHVGVFLRADLAGGLIKRLPHARGGVSACPFERRHTFESSPRTWGCFRHPVELPGREGVFPTHVGVFPSSRLGSEMRPRLPHARGGVSRGMANRKHSLQSSPRTWGCFLATAMAYARGCVFPTHVGVFLSSGLG